MPDNLPTPEQLEAWGALCEQATPGPWRLNDWPPESTEEAKEAFVEIATEDGDGVFLHVAQWAPKPADAELLRTARTALPSLLAAYRALREENDTLVLENAALHAIRDAAEDVVRLSMACDATTGHSVGDVAAIREVARRALATPSDRL